MYISVYNAVWGNMSKSSETKAPHVSELSILLSSRLSSPQFLFFTSCGATLSSSPY